MKLILKLGKSIKKLLIFGIVWEETKEKMIKLWYDSEFWFSLWFDQENWETFTDLVLWNAGCFNIQESYSTSEPTWVFSFISVAFTFENES